MDYRKEHAIGKRLRARKTLWPYTFPLSRKKPANSLLDNNCNENVSETSPSDDSKSLTDYVSEQLLEQISILNSSPSTPSRKKKTTSDDSVVTFKRKTVEDPDITFKIEHDALSTGQSQISTRPCSERSELSASPAELAPDEVSSSNDKNKVKTEHIDDEISFTEVIPEFENGSESSTSDKESNSEDSTSNKKDRSRAASLDARVRTMLLLEKQKPSVSLPLKPEAVVVKVEPSAEKQNPTEKTKPKPSTKKLINSQEKSLAKTQQWFDDCFASNSKTVNKLKKAKEKSLKELQAIERKKVLKKKRQCRSCMKMLKFLLVKTSRELLEQIVNPAELAPKQVIESNSSQKEAICEKCQQNQSIETATVIRSVSKCQVKLTKLPNELLEQSGSSAFVGASTSASLTLHDQNLAPNTVSPKTSPAASSWQFEGEPFNKRIYCRHPDGQYRLAVRSCYSTVVNDDVTLSRGDYVLIAAQSRSQPFVAAITDLYICPISGGKMAHIYWFYGEEILANHRKLHERELMASKHADDIDLNCIDDKCYVLTRQQYGRYVADQMMRRDNRWLKRMSRRPLTLSRVTPPVRISPQHASQRIPSLERLNEADPELVFWCSKVFDLQRKQILKNPH